MGIVKGYRVNLGADKKDLAMDSSEDCTQCILKAMNCTLKNGEYGQLSARYIFAVLFLKKLQFSCNLKDGQDTAHSLISLHSR